MFDSMGIIDFVRHFLALHKTFPFCSLSKKLCTLHLERLKEKTFIKQTLTVLSK